MPLRATYLGHASVLLESGGLAVITDPIFSDKIFWIRRRALLPLAPTSLPPLAAIFVTHAHYDHLDLPSYKYFSQKIPIVTPPGLKKLLQKFLKNPLLELDPGRRFQISPRLSVTAFPVTHFGFRLLPFRYTRCNGYLIEFAGDTAYRSDFKNVASQMRGVGGRAGSSPDFSEASGFARAERIDRRQIFFVGDTAYRDFRKDLSQMGGVDLALLPIACYRPEWIMKGRHMTPAEAVRVFEEIDARTMIPIHWGTFRLSTEPFDEPIDWLRRIAAERGLAERIRILKPGESYAEDRAKLSVVHE